VAVRKTLASSRVSEPVRLADGDDREEGPERFITR